MLKRLKYPLLREPGGEAADEHRGGDGVEAQLQDVCFGEAPAHQHGEQARPDHDADLQGTARFRM